MADPTPREQLQPCLLDRLTDDRPDEKEESRNDRVIGSDKLVKAVQRDLEWLFNTIAPSDESALAGLPNVAESVYSYGIRSLWGLTHANLGEADLQAVVRNAILRFEPRIFPDSLEVKVFVRPDEYGPDAVVFEIRAKLWAKPQPEPLFIRTRLDLDTGQVDRIENAPGRSGTRP